MSNSGCGHFSTVLVTRDVACNPAAHCFFKHWIVPIALVAVQRAGLVGSLLTLRNGLR